MKLETSNLAQTWTAVSTNEKMQNLVKSGHEGSRDPHLEFWDPLISLERLKLKTSNLAQKWTAVGTNEKMQNWVKRGHEGVT